MKYKTIVLAVLLVLVVTVLPVAADETDDTDSTETTNNPSIIDDTSGVAFSIGLNLVLFGLLLLVIPAAIVGALFMENWQ